MKKVKTILVSLLIALASSFMTACSCTGGGEDTAVTPVPATSISIDCTSSNVLVEKDDFGCLEIICRVGDKFSIQYTLSPTDTTTTRVNWEYEGRDDVLYCDRNTYSQSSSEPVTFTARNEGQVTIVFETAAVELDKTIEAKVIVRPVESPTYVKVTGIDYDTEKNEITWDRIKKQTMPNNTDEVDINQADFSNYLVKVTDLTKGVSLTPIMVTDNKLPIGREVGVDKKITLERGIEYSVVVIAQGFKGAVNDSPDSDPFMFCLLDSATELKNNDGVFSFTSPKFSSDNVIYLNYDETKDLEKLTSYITPATSTSVHLNNFTQLSKYNLAIISYPSDFNKALGYGTKTNGVRYYPSLASEVLTLKRFDVPTVEVLNKTGSVVAGGVTFNNELNGVTFKPTTHSEFRWSVLADEYPVKYAYAIYNGNTKIYPENSSDYIIVDSTSDKYNGFDASVLYNDKNVSGECELRVYALGDPTNTIRSQEYKLRFSVLKPLDSSTSSHKDVVTGTQDFIYGSATSGNVYAMDIFYINTDNNTGVYQQVSGVNQGLYASTSIDACITDAKLGAGHYDVYARYVGVPTTVDTSSNPSITSPLVKIFGNDTNNGNSQIVVCAPVTNVELYSDWTIEFTPHEDDIVRDGNQNIINYTGAYDIVIEQYQTEGSKFLTKITTTVTYAGKGVSYDANKYATEYPTYYQNIKYYDGENGKLKVYIEDIIGHHMSKDKNVTADTIKQTIEDFSSFANQLYISIVTNGGDNRISSIATSDLRAQRLPKVEVVELYQNQLKFNYNTATSVDFSVEIEGHSALQAGSSGNILIPLDNIKSSSGATSGVNLLQYVNKTGSTSVLLSVKSRQQSTTSGNLFWMASGITETSFGATEKPTQLSMDESGNLYFLSSNNEGNRSFRLIFKKNGEDVDLLDEDNSKLSGSKFEDETVIKNDENIVYGKFKFDVLNLIKNEYDKNPTEETIYTLEVYETSDSKFAGLTSEKFYVFMLPKLSITLENYNGTIPAIKFSGVSKVTAEYSLTINDGGEFTQYLPNSSIAIQTIDESVGILTLSLDTIGSYTIKVQPFYVNGDDNTGSSSNNAYVLLGDSTSQTIEIKDKAITTKVNADGNSVSWTAISGASYNFEYNGTTLGSDKYTGSSTTVEVQSLLNDGVNTIKITPSIDFADTGIILQGSVTENKVTKLATPSNFDVVGGNLTFRVYDQSKLVVGEDADPNLPELVDEGDGSENGEGSGTETPALNGTLIIKLNDTVLSPKNCVITYTDVTKTVEDKEVYDYTLVTISDISSAYTGETVFNVQYKNTNSINSNWSEDYTATILDNAIVTEGDFEKIDNYVYWKPIANTNKYILRINYDGTTKTINLYYDPTASEGNQYKYEIVDENGEKIAEGVDTTIFGLYTEVLSVDDGGNPVETLTRLRYKLDDSEFSGIGIYEITLQATSEGAYISGKISDAIVVTKVSNEVSISPATGNQSGVVISGYKNTQGETTLENPKYFQITIEQLKEKVESEPATQEDGGEEDVTEDTSDDIVIATRTLDMVDFGSESSNITGTTGYLVDFEKYPAGIYRVIIKFYGDCEITGKTVTGADDKIISSDVYMSEKFTKLPTTALYTEGGELKWLTVDDATDYALDLANGFDSLNEFGAGIPATIEEETEDEETPATPTIITLTNDQINALGLNALQTYDSKVRALGDGSTIISSSWSTPFKVRRLSVIDNMYIDCNDQGYAEFKWADIDELIDANNGASMKFKYRLVYDYVGENEEITDEIVSAYESDPVKNGIVKVGNFYTHLIKTDKKVGKYLLRLQVLGNSALPSVDANGVVSYLGMGLLTSDFTSEENSNSVTYAINTCSPYVANGKLNWNEIKDEESKLSAYKYKLTITNPESTEVIKYTGATSYSFLDTELSVAGSYSVKIDGFTVQKYRVGDPEKPDILNKDIVLLSTNTDELKKTVNTTTLYKNPSPERLNVIDGALSWSFSINKLYDFVVANHSKLVNSPLKQELNLSEGTGANTTNTNLIIAHLIEKINAKETAKINDILSFLFEFDMTINGIKYVVTPESAKAVKVDESKLTLNERYIDYNSNYYGNANYIMYYFNPNLTVSNPADNIATADDGEQLKPGEYVFKIAGRGNTTSDKVTIAVISSEYTSELKTFKPNTPRTWVKEDFTEDAIMALTEGEDDELGGEDGEDGETPDTPVADFRGIVNGNILLERVTTNKSKFVSHSHGCYGDDGSVICGKEEHTHILDKAEENTCIGLVCGKEEVSHTHTTTCYEFDAVSGTYNLICVIVNHAHNDECYGLTCGKVEHTHISNCIGLICPEEHEHTNTCYGIACGLTNGQTVGEIEFHDNYRFTIASGQVSETHDFSTADRSHIIDNIAENLYYNHIKSYFSVDNDMHDTHTIINPNTNYKLYVNVRGTVDSSMLNAGDYAYLNSDKYEFQNEVNILQNKNIFMNNSQYSWGVSQGSTQTRVIIYGPFDYAPLDDSDTESLAEWKARIQSDFNKLVDDDKDNDETTNAKRRVKYFPNDPNGSQNTQMLSISKDIESYLNEFSFGAGGYIIRKQEVGDNRGIIDTELEEILFVDGEPDYGMIVNKLDIVTAVDGSWLGKTGFKDGNEFEATQGMFVWNTVPRANTYKVIIKEYNVDNDNGDIVIGEHRYVANATEHEYFVYDEAWFKNGLTSQDFDNLNNTSRTMKFDMPDFMNLQGFTGATNSRYSISIIAMRVATKEDITSIDTYFQGDSEETTKHLRVAPPTDMEITRNGTLEWTHSIGGTEVSSYLTKANDNTLYFAGYVNQDDGNLIGKINFGELNQDATFDVAVKAIATIQDGYLNSSYTASITIAKLGSPNTKLEDGVFKWGNGSEEISEANPTETEFGLYKDGVSEFDSEYIILDPSQITYPLYTEIISYDQNYNPNDEKYDASEYTFKVRFRGSEGLADDENNVYYITSATTEFTATKLQTPAVEEDNSIDEGVFINRLKWDPIDYAFGYKIRAIDKDSRIYELIIVNDDVKVIDDLSKMDDSKILFNVNDTIYLNLNKFLTTANDSISSEALKTMLEAGVKVYVQALGASEVKVDGQPTYADGKYLTSSYSNVNIYKLPVAPTNGRYNYSTGEISWVPTEADLTNTNVLLTMQYKVSNVSQEEFDNYWSYTGKDNKVVNALGLESRQVTKSGDTAPYELSVVDVVYLPYNQSTKETPKTYQLKNIGSNYMITVTMVSSYISDDYTFNVVVEGSNNTINFDLFGKGDGTENYPYTIANETQLKRVADFTDRRFKLTDNIALAEQSNDNPGYNLITGMYTNWTMINNFSGVIDGAGYSITNVSNPIRITTNSGVNYYKMAMFGELTEDAVIKNLTIGVDYSTKLALNALNVAGLALTNNGTIDNVHINGNIVIETKTDKLYVAGLVVTNNGTISNSSVTTDSTTYVCTANASHNGSANQISRCPECSNPVTITRKGIYALNETSQVSQVGGIAYSNKGTISSTHFDGELYGNFIGGITVINEGDIDKCYSNGLALVSSEIKGSTDKNNVTYGGLIAEYHGGEITNSYSQLVVTLYNLGTTVHLGGLIGYIEASVENVTIKNCYVVNNVTNITSGSENPTFYAFISNVNDNILISENNYYVTETNTYGTTVGEVNGVTGFTELANLNSAFNNNATLLEIYLTHQDKYPTHK